MNKTIRMQGSFYVHVRVYSKHSYDQFNKMISSLVVRVYMLWKSIEPIRPKLAKVKRIKLDFTWVRVYARVYICEGP